MKNGYYIIDSHCHIYPEKIAQAASDHTSKFYDLAMCGTGTPASLMEDSARAGIDMCVVQSVALKPSQVRSINKFIAESVAASKGRFVGLGTLHPDSEDVAGDIEHLVSLGLHGVKLHPDMQEFKLDDYRFLKMYELCEGRLPMLIHTGDFRYDFSNPNRMLPILEIYKNLTVVGAHFGGWSVWEDAVKTLASRHFDNFYVDSSSSFYAHTDGQIRDLISAFGVDRVLFGVDYPMWDPSGEVDRLFGLGLPEEDLKKIFAQNAKLVYNII
ncbi:MAG: amidohydrolase family protein [Clostridia bacterium]|nr:amidohydrolase family protein [Clostridia bacterium]